jgi:hypothetical protein
MGMPGHRLRCAKVSVAGICCALACGGPLEPRQTLAPGMWGGDHAVLVVTRDTVTLGLDCAVGWMSAPVTLDALGRFDHGGSVQSQVGAVRPPVPARFSGSVSADAKTITLQLTVIEPPQPFYVLGPYHLVRDQQVTLALCR